MRKSHLDALAQQCREQGLEVFRADRKDVAEWNKGITRYDTPYRVGWYWWSCFPGCLPDSDPSGPFPSPTRACEDALGML